MKRVAGHMISMRMKPNRIYNNILDRFGYTEGESPTLKQVQSFVGHFKRSVLSETDYIEDMVALVNRTQFTADMHDGEAFTFAYNMKADGSPLIGTGSDDDPTLVGIATPCMIKKLELAKEYVLHIDTTYKLNQSGYPVLVVGLSDQSRSFHPIALFITSQQTGEHINSALTSLFRMYNTITGGYPDVQYCMGDADKAQRNAVEAVTTTMTSNRTAAVYLMCFFHVVKNVADQVSKKPIELVSLVFKHYSRSAEEFSKESESAESVCKTKPELTTSTAYFKKQWVDSPFANWGCHHTPIGFAKTNNPIEQFNNTIKRDYSLRTLLKLVALAEQLTVMCRHRSRGKIVFDLDTKPNRELQARFKYLMNNGRISVIQPHKHGLDFLLDGPSQNHIAYVYQRGAPPRIPDPDEEKAKKKLGKRTKHRMELFEQPVGGWRVDMEANSCPCRSWYKYKLCAHVLAALKATVKSAPGTVPPKDRFVNRRRKRKGRNADVGPALYLE